MKKIQNYNRPKPIKIYLVSIVCLTVLVTVYLYSKRSKNSVVHQNGINKEEIKYVPKKRIAFSGERIVHIDLKGAPPKLSYYKYLFPLFVKLGVTGVLMEYEDMFPYDAKTLNVSAFNAYNLNDIKEINKLAEEHNLKVIPLIQTFGHLEFVLKLADYQDYREVPEYPQVICPSYQKTEKLIEEMIKQIVTAHPNSEYLHLGADEVNYLGVCDRCNDLMLTNKLTKNQLYIKYINTIAKIVKKLYPNLKILIWDDQLRSFTEEDLRLDNFHKNVIPVIWKYTKDVYDDLGPSLWDNYKKVYKNVWIASAFKGATGSNEIVTYVTHYLQNHRSWLSVVTEYENQFNFQGIIITGWQRYDHFAVLCELLPVGIPTLAMCLRLLLGYNDSPLSPPKEVAKILKCQQPYALMGPVFGSPKCAFPGGDILEHIIHFQQLKQEFEVVIEDFRYKGWLNNFNVKNCFSNTAYVESATNSLSRLREDLIELKADLNSSMQKLYDEYTIEEWLESYFTPLESQVEALWSAKNKLLRQKVWSRRPLKRNKCDL